MANQNWVYIYRVGGVEHRYCAPNRKTADKLASGDGVPSSAFVGKY